MAKQKISRLGNSVIVYDDAVSSQLSPAMFEAGYWPDADIVPGYSGGRGATLCVSYGGEDWVIKHYHRGGLVGRILQDGFPYVGFQRVRSVIELNILRAATARGLPAPEPVAAHFRRRLVIYTADLITRRIPDVEPLSARLAKGPVSRDIWYAVGQCIRRFHDAGFFHADLSAHNLQIDSADRIWLLDWDRGRILPPGAWQAANLNRLQRSCIKIREIDAADYADADWRALTEGYRAGADDQRSA